MTYKLSIQTAPGCGLLSRYGDVVVFIPEPSAGVEALLAAFTECVQGEQLSSVANSLVEHDLDFPAFVIVDVGSAITLRAFGNVQLRTDIASVPLLSAGESTTWVDHIVHGTPAAATISAGDEPPADLTGLITGVVHAGGFAAQLQVVDGVNVERAIVPPATVDPAGVAPVGAMLSAELAPRSVSSEDTSDLLKYVLGAFDPDEAEPDTLDESDIVDESPSKEATLPGKAPIGRLVFDDGNELDVMGDIVLGRNPEEVANTTRSKPVIITGDRVSRAHLRLRVADGQPWVEDCDSRNGSVIVAKPGQQPFGLTPGSPQEIDDGATVYIGSRSFTFAAKERVQ